MDYVHPPSTDTSPGRSHSISPKQMNSDYMLSKNDQNLSMIFDKNRVVLHF
jgi:hypothetical protein